MKIMIKQQTIKFLKDTRISRGGLAVALYLLNIGGVWTKGQCELAHVLGEISQRQLVDNLNNLVSLGYLIKEKSPQGRNAKVYRLKEEKNG
ncbi:MAG: hypothetical protein ACD_19C00187G0015 [uncultured bacterium]|nr:MAG: hypothetical protein ACD_19C00187G0015 [uncultured bacterium]